MDYSVSTLVTGVEYQPKGEHGYLMAHTFINMIDFWKYGNFKSRKGDALCLSH